MKKILFRFLWVLIILSVIEFQPDTVSGTDNHISYHDYADTVADYDSGKSIAIAGDLQRTSIWEVMMGREQNDEERVKLISAVKQENPSMLILLGDMVFDGSNPSQWNYLDNLLSPLKDIPILPVIGNHEYYGNSSMFPLRYLKCRFPQFKKSGWYTRKYGSIALIFLNSNDNEIRVSEWKEQEEWFSKMLDSCDADPGIKGILVFMHHPPYSNSIVTGDDDHVQKAFLKSFNRSEKTLALITGHAHTYERFKIDGKEFIVSGGGGGPRVLLSRGTHCHKDECNFKGIRPFNYILVHPGENSVSLTVKGLNKGESSFFLLDSVTIPYAKISSPIAETHQ